jgi:predicted  nucleic acid-binding Zn-ribbon protein
MTVAIAGDTPIHRLNISEMADDQVEQHIEKMRERRMRLFTAWQEAQQHAEEMKLQKDRAQMKKRLEQMEKVFKTVDNGLEKLSKYMSEIRVLRLTAGDFE